jgi:hypothetical protein
MPRLRKEKRCRTILLDLALVRR